MSWKTIQKNLIKYSLPASLLIGETLFLLGRNAIRISNLIYGLLFGLVLIFPFLLTLINVSFLLSKKDDVTNIRTEKYMEYVTIVLGSIYSFLYLGISDILYMDWTQTLRNGEQHTPIWSGGMMSIIIIFCISIAGYFLLSFMEISKVPPLVSVCAIAAMYLGILLCIVWIIQLSDSWHLMLCLFPFNCIIIAAKTIRHTLAQWKAAQKYEPKVYRNQYLDKMNQYLLDSGKWPVAALLLMWPLLGVIILVLILFGQQPDSVIKAWTETSDWRLSQQIAPQNVIYDEHYLCTVAAGGHAGIVRPLRMGERHGHRVVVNRQLCVANAFEQILEERLPVVHKHVRSFYDRYGFPIARLIRSPYAADGIYILMKPLEWVFLAVIYFCDVDPENRIAVQYLPKARIGGAVYENK